MTRGRGLVLLFALVLFAWNAWGYDLWAPDEPYFGEGAREMAADGQWLIPHVNGVITTDKPPLFFWSIALLSLPFGHVYPLLARLPSILAALGSVWLVMRLARRFAGERAGLLAGVVFTTAYLPWDKARSAQIESLLCFLVLAAVSAFEAYRAGELEGRRAGVLFWVAGGLATLAKGPVGILLPLGIALTTLAVDRRLALWRRFAPLAGPVAFLLVLAAWGVPATLYGGEYSLVGALRTHFVDRALHGMHHQNPPWYYLGTIPVQFLPWSTLLPLALLSAWRHRREATMHLLLAWPAFVVLFFTLSGERRDLYVLPAFPALAILVALAVDPLLDRARGDVATRWVSVPLGMLGALFLAAGVGVPFAAGRAGAFPAIAVSALSAALLAGGATLGWSALRSGPRAQVASVTFAAALLYLATASLVYPALDGTKSARRFALELEAASRASRAAGERVVAFRLGNVPEAIAFYSGVYTLETTKLEELVRHLERPGAPFAALDERVLTELPAGLRERLTVLAKDELSRKQVVLVTARRETRP